tara:strand:+ start:477 stop:704 length:228 start_codon:yes stop_codon:yes gene_type:complete
MREVEKNTVLEYKAKNDFLYYCECSAKSGNNVEKLFADCSRFIYHKYKDKIGQMKDDDDSENDSVDNDAMNNSFS